MEFDDLQARIDALEADPSALRGDAGTAVDDVLDALDRGELRVCEPTDAGWITHAWVKRAILLYFRRHESEEIGVIDNFGIAASPQATNWQRLHMPPSYFDKVPTKRNYAELGARCVPPGVARYGSFLGRGSILMPGFVNIGAYVDDGSMVDTWGDGRFVRADRQERAPRGRRRHRRRARAAAGATRDRRGRRVRRLALRRRRRRVSSGAKPYSAPASC